MERTLLNSKWLVLSFSFITAFVSLALFAISISPLTPFEGYDSSMFKQMGEACLQGKVLYRDMFDHKGPFIFFIDAFGLWLTPNRWGLFVLAVLNLTGVLFLWNKIASHYTEGIKTYLAVTVGLLAYLGALEEGNQTEDWCLLPISYALYLMSRRFALGKDVLLWESLLIGIFAGVVLFIRANNAALMVCSVLYLTLMWVKELKYKTLIFNYMAMAAGFIAIVAGCLTYFYVAYGAEGLNQMLFGTFTFNFRYAGFSTYYDFLVSSLYNHAYFLGSIVLIVLAYLNNKDTKGNKMMTAFLLFSFFFCYYTMGTASFRHYMTLVAPLFLIAASYAFHNSTRPYILFICVALLTYEPFFKKQMQFSIGSVKRGYMELYNQFDEILESIEPEERNKIWNYNGEMTGVGLLQHNRLVQCNRVILNFHREKSIELQKTENGKLQKTAPKYVLYNPDKEYVLQEDSIFLNTKYEQIGECRLEQSSKNAEVHICMKILRKRNEQK